MKKILLSGLLCFASLQNALAQPIYTFDEREFLVTYVEKEVSDLAPPKALIEHCAILPVVQLKSDTGCESVRGSILDGLKFYRVFQRGLAAGTTLSEEDQAGFQRELDEAGELTADQRVSYQLVYMSIIVGTYVNKLKSEYQPTETDIQKRYQKEIDEMYQEYDLEGLVLRENADVTAVLNLLNHGVPLTKVRKAFGVQKADALNRQPMVLKYGQKYLKTSNWGWHNSTNRYMYLGIDVVNLPDLDAGKYMPCMLLYAHPCVVRSTQAPRDTKDAPTYEQRREQIVGDMRDEYSDKKFGANFERLE